MQNRIILEPGIYTNVFPVDLSETPLNAVIANREDFQDLRALRAELRGTPVRLFADSRIIYGYGTGSHGLESRGFQLHNVNLNHTPNLAKRLIVEGVSAAVAQDGYEQRDRIGRLIIHQAKPHASVARGVVRVHLGYDLRAVYWRPDPDAMWEFGLVADVRWSVRDDSGPLSSEAIASYGAMIEVARAQGEFLPGANRINTEVSRLRFQEHILPFVVKYERLPLPNGQGRILPEPVRVVLGTRR
jgi:hypothetical protein